MPRPTKRLYLLIVAAAVLAAGCDVAETNSAPADISGGRGTPVSPSPTVSFVEGYAPGYRLAEQQGKPMLVFFTAGWCSFCKQMAAETFTDADVVEWSGRFVCILVDADAEPDTCRQFRVRGYPTVQFVSPQGVPLNRVVGRRPADQLVPQMQAALSATASRTVPTTLR